jgi:hypothetical protein
MLNDVWLQITYIISQAGWWGFLILAMLAFFHPTFEAPTAIFLLILMTIFIGNPWLAALVLLGFHTLGFIFYYYLLHALHKKSGYILKRFRVSHISLLWLKQQPTWKHIVVIGMPMVYTYPLRVAFTLNHTNIGVYAWQTLAQYLVLYIGNMLMYQLGVVFLNLDIPLWQIALLLALIAISIYTIKPRVIKV